MATVIVITAIFIGIFYPEIHQKICPFVFNQTPRERETAVQEQRLRQEIAAKDGKIATLEKNLEGTVKTILEQKIQVDEVNAQVLRIPQLEQQNLEQQRQIEELKKQVPVENNANAPRKSSGQPDDSAEAQLRALQEELDRAQSEVMNLRGQLGKSHFKISALENVPALESLKLPNQEIQRLENELRKKNEELEELKKRLSEGAKEFRRVVNVLIKADLGEEMFNAATGKQEAAGEPNSNKPPVKPRVSTPVNPAPKNGSKSALPSALAAPARLLKKYLPLNVM